MIYNVTMHAHIYLKCVFTLNQLSKLLVFFIFHNYDCLQETLHCIITIFQSMSQPYSYAPDTCKVHHSYGEPVIAKLTRWLIFQLQNMIWKLGTVHFSVRISKFEQR